MNGLIEQWGYESGDFPSGEKTVNLFVTFSNINYLAISTLNQSAGSGYIPTVEILSTSSIKIYATLQGSNRRVSWLVHK